MTQVPRRFGLFDAVILLVPTALALWIIRSGPALLELVARNSSINYNLANWWQAMEFAQTLCALALAGFTVALLVLRLRRPRPARLRLWRQPGAAALLASASVLGLMTAGSAVLLARVGWPSIDDLIWNNGAPLFPLPGAAVLGVWITLAASGRWKAERSWIDRSGRAAGAAWVLLFGLSLGLHYRNEIASFLPFQREFVRMATQQEQLRQMTERHEEAARSRVARFADLHALRDHFAAKGEWAQVEVIDRLLQEWDARQTREIAAEDNERKRLLGNAPTPP